jgi:hypothetical protein
LSGLFFHETPLLVERMTQPNDGYLDLGMQQIFPPKLSESMLVTLRGKMSMIKFHVLIEKLEF